MQQTKPNNTEQPKSASTADTLCTQRGLRLTRVRRLVLEYLLNAQMPVKAYDLVNTADMVLRQLERRIKKKTRTPKKRSEKEQNYIRNAKFLLMERNYLTEEEAHKYLQKCSMDNGTNMVETAQMILMLIYDEC